MFLVVLDQMSLSESIYESFCIRHEIKSQVELYIVLDYTMWAAPIYCFFLQDIVV
jgi:hypothetical protein